MFYFTDPDDQHKEIARVLITKEKPIYIIRADDISDDELKTKLPRGVFDLAMKEQAFCDEYKIKNGLDWKHYYGPNGPRAPPTLYMHPADYVGQKIERVSSEGHWHCEGPARDCQSKEHVNMTLEVISQTPRAYIADIFLSDVEVDAIIAYAKKRVAASTVGQDEGGGVRSSDTRTSRNTWIDRSASPIFESLFKRAAHLINVDEKLLTEHKNAERLQVVNYANGQKYDAHHDWGVSGYPESRYLTLLLYLTDQEDENSGGETSFPKAADGKGIKIVPKKGSAAMFYSVLPDGNGDDLSAHASLPVHRGEKWLANMWVWDSSRR